MRNFLTWVAVLVGAMIVNCITAHQWANAGSVIWSRSQPAVVLDAKDFVVISGRTFNVGALLNQHEELWQEHKQNKQPK